MVMMQQRIAPVAGRGQTSVLHTALHKGCLLQARLPLRDLRRLTAHVSTGRSPPKTLSLFPDDEYETEETGASESLKPFNLFKVPGIKPRVVILHGSRNAAGFARRLPSRFRSAYDVSLLTCEALAGQEDEQHHDNDSLVVHYAPSCKEIDTAGRRVKTCFTSSEGTDEAFCWTPYDVLILAVDSGNLPSDTGACRDFFVGSLHDTPYETPLRKALGLSLEAASLAAGMGPASKRMVSFTVLADGPLAVELGAELYSVAAREDCGGWQDVDVRFCKPQSAFEQLMQKQRLASAGTAAP